MAKSSKQRKEDQRERDKKHGITQINVRVHQDDKQAVKDYAQALLDKRLRLQD
ncbi:hypothetical protein ABXZ88_003896 [Vibrio fluvialis]